jgi:hypothetical protein
MAKKQPLLVLYRSIDINNNFYLIGYEEHIYPIKISVKDGKIMEIQQF